jgi:hypothetical protein
MKTRLRPIKSSKLSDKYTSNKNNIIKSQRTPKHNPPKLLDDFLEVR